VVVRQSRAIVHKLQSLHDRLSAEAKLFAAVNYTSVLARGFVLVLDDDDRPIKLAASVSSGQNLKVRFIDDTLSVTANKKTSQGELF
jgi:exodeoxyribonuclease VII large subunit